MAEALDIYTKATSQVSGLARTARGPVMSSNPGKVIVDGVVNVGREKAFALKFVQARNPEFAGQMFFAKFDPEALWLDDLRPLNGEDKFFFEQAKL